MPRGKRSAAETSGDLDRNVRKKGKTTKNTAHRGAGGDPNAFSTLAVAEELKQGLADMQLETMTELQAKCVPRMLAGEDVVAVADSGSGKRVAFLLSAAQRLHQLAFSPDSGTGVIVVSPTRESALQTCATAKELLRHSPFTTGLVMDGTNQDLEETRLQKHISVLVATPQRLLSHLQTARGFVWQKLACLVIDGLDVMLKQGSAPVLQALLHALPKKRHTSVFVTELTPEAESLCEAALTTPAQISATAAQAAASDWQQGYTVVEADKKFLLLYSFLRKNQDKKVAVFFATCAEVKYFVEMLPTLGIPAVGIHGTQKAAKRAAVLSQFDTAAQGTLLCTDLVTKGVQIKGFDWVLHYDPPECVGEYLRRIGSTARGDIQAKTLVLLHPNELAFLSSVQPAHAFEYQFSPNKLAGVQSHYEKILDRNYHLHVAAKAAHRAFVLAYATHQDKDVFDIQQLDLMKVGKAFGFPVAPRVNYNEKKTGGRREIGGKDSSAREDK